MLHSKTLFRSDVVAKVSSWVLKAGWAYSVEGSVMNGPKRLQHHERHDRSGQVHQSSDEKHCVPVTARRRQHVSERHEKRGGSFRGIEQTRVGRGVLVTIDVGAGRGEE